MGDFSTAYSDAFDKPASGIAGEIFLLTGLDALYKQTHNPMLYLVEKQPLHWGETRRPLERIS